MEEIPYTIQFWHLSIHDLDRVFLSVIMHWRWTERRPSKLDFKACDYGWEEGRESKEREKELTKFVS